MNKQRNINQWSLLVAILFALALVTTACNTTSEHPKSDKSEHPTTEQQKSAKPEHPTTEHPK